MSSVEKVLAVARAEIGYIEDAGNKSKFNREYYGSNLSADWCATFLVCIFNSAGFGYLLFGSIPDARKAVAEGVKNWMLLAQKKSRWITSGYNVGDIVLFDFNNNKVPDHIGIIDSIQGSTFYTIEGNTKMNSGGREGVERKTRSASQFFGAFRPAYPEGSVVSNVTTPSEPPSEKPNTEEVRPPSSNFNPFKKGQSVRVKEGSTFELGEIPKSFVFKKVYRIDTFKVVKGVVYARISPNGLSPWTGWMAIENLTEA